MAIQNLPEELLIQIFDFVLLPDLSRLALCSKSFYRAAVPRLYSSFEDNRLGKRMIKLLSTIIVRPDLALFVKAFASNGPDTVYHDETPPIVPDDMRPRIKSELTKAGVDEHMKDFWHNRICGHPSDNCWEATVALCMLLLPNLSTLKIPYYHEWCFSSEPKCIPYVFARAVKIQNSNTPSPYAMTQLRNLSIGLVSEDIGLIHLTTMAFLELKSIRSLTSENDEDYTKDFEDYPGTLPHVTRLTFKEADISPPILAKLLKPFSSLTHFTLNARRRTKIYRGFSPQTFKEAMLRSQQTLEELTLKNTAEEFWYSYTSYDYDGEDQDLPLGSLVGFTKLRRLEATLRTLVRCRRAEEDSRNEEEENTRLRIRENTRFAESLPDSMEEIMIWECGGDVFPLIVALFEKKHQGGLQRLKMIDVTFNFVRGLESFDEEWPSLDSEADKLGVVVKRRKGEYPVYSDDWRAERLHQYTFHARVGQPS
jgi:F-box-like